MYVASNLFDRNYGLEDETPFVVSRRLNLCTNEKSGRTINLEFGLILCACRYRFSQIEKKI